MTPLDKLRVFVVDDEPVIAKTLAAILENAGFAAEPFVDPLEALKAAEFRCPDIMISDVMMPQINGIELGIQVRAIYPECRILLFSGQAATSDLLRDADSKVHQFTMLSKPVHPKDLLVAIQSEPRTSPA
jgi:CheY-like chemotaxis protein